MNYESLFLGIRQYDCDVSEEHLDSLSKLLYDLKPHPLLPGNQVQILDDSKYLHPCLYDVIEDRVAIESIKKSFVKCCEDYFKLHDNYSTKVRLWCYRDWKSNDIETGSYWHKHSDTFYALSGVLYLTFPEGSTTTSFSLNPLITNYQELNDLKMNKFERSPAPISESEIVSLPPIKHKWFIFPSILPHFPGSWKETDEKRICIGADWWPDSENFSYKFGESMKNTRYHRNNIPQPPINT